MSLTEQEIIEICKSRVDVSRLAARNYSLCIDGTSCTKKSSILAGSGRLVSKNQRINPNQNSDTFFPSMIGYITSGIANLTCGGPHFEDRSPMNVMDWHVLWKVFDDYLKRFGNEEPNEANDPEMRNAFSMYRVIFNALKNWYIYKMFGQDINTIVLIDSNVGRCDSLRFARGTSSDCQRSLWKFYTPLQNLMYRELYEGLYIDLDWFGDADSSDVVTGIGKFLAMVLDTLTARPNLKYPPLINRRLPMVKCDYTLDNITTHVYRSIGRHGCQLLMGVDETLKSRLPSYLNVTNIDHPMGQHIAPSIVSSTREYLFNSRRRHEDAVDDELVFPTMTSSSILLENGREDCDMSEMFL